MKTFQYLGVIAVSLLLYATVFANEATAQGVDTPTLIAALKNGGYVMVLRHGETDHNQKDAQPPDYTDVTKQRRLSEKGRETARGIGEAIKKLGLAFDKVETSLLDRGIETGKLVASTEVMSSLDLTENSDAVDPAEKERRLMALEKMVGVMPEPGKNTLLVTHKPNIVGAFGKALEDIDEGEIAVFKPDGSGKSQLVGRIKEADWAGAPSGAQM